MRINRRALAARSFDMVNGGTTPRNATVWRPVWVELNVQDWPMSGSGQSRHFDSVLRSLVFPD